MRSSPKGAKLVTNPHKRRIFVPDYSITMSNSEKYVTAFANVFNVDAASIGADFSSTSVDNWDSITQLSLVTEIEDTFDIMLDTEDILNFKSFEEGKAIIAKYGVEV